MTKIITAEERIARAEKIKEYKEAKREYEIAKNGGQVPPQGAMRNVDTQQNNAERVAEQSTKYDNKGVNAGVRLGATFADVGADIITGAFKGLEGIYDLGASLVGWVGGLFSKDFQNNVKKHIEYDASKEWLAKPMEEGFTKYSYMNDNKAGEIFDNIFTGVGQMLPTVALAALTAGGSAAGSVAGTAATTAAKVGAKVGTAALMAGAAGNATEEAFNDGASYSAGMGYGLTQGALEGGMEVMTGGVGRLAKMTGKVGVKSVGKEIGKEMLSEAFEEGTQELLTPLTRGIYKGTEAFEEYKDPELYKNALQSAVVGGAVGGIMSGGSYGVSSIKNKDMGGNKALFVQNGLAEINELSKKENAEWNKGELDGVKYEKIHNEINNNYKEISRQLMSEKPEIRANSIEKFNLNNTFNKDGTIKDGVLVSQEEMKSRFNTEPQNIYAGQPQMLAEGQPQLQTLQDGQPQNMAKVDALANANEQVQNKAFEGQNALGGQTVMANEVVQNSELASRGNTATMQTIGNQYAMPTKPMQSHNKNAYNPSLRNTELLLAPTSGEISQSGKAAKDTISAISPNMRMVITDIGEFNGNRFNAFVDNKSGIVYVNNNANSVDIMKAVAVHEITHTLEGTKQYEKLSKFVVDSLPDFDTRVANKIKEYANTNAQLKQGENAEILSIYEAKTEVIADYMGELLSNEQSIRRLALKDKSLTIRIFEWIKNALAKLVGKGDSKSENYKFLRKAESLYAKAMQNAVGGISLAEIDEALSKYKEMAEAEESQNNNETEKIAESKRFSIKIDEKNRQYVKADKKVIFGDSPKVWATQITSFINGVIRGGKDIRIKTVEGDVLTITENTAGKATYRNEIKKADGNYRKLTDDEYKTKLNAEAHIDELSKISLAQKDENGIKTIKEDMNLKHIARGLAKDGWNYRSAYFMDFDGTMYKVRLSVAIDGTVASVYNVGKLKSIPQSPTANGVGVSDSKVKRNTSNISILNNSKKVNEKEKNSNDLNNAKVKEVVKSEKLPIKEEKNKTGEDVRYSKQKPFAEQVDDVLSGKQERFSDVYVMETPKILQDVGLNDLPMLMTANHIKKINLPKDNAMHQHGVSAEIIKKIPSMLAHPVMIMDSISHNPNSSIVIIGEEVVDNEPMLIAVRVDGHGIENKIIINSNFITSAYGKDNFENFIKRSLKESAFLYVDKKRSQVLFSLVGVQFPEGFNNLNFNTIIRKTKANVNTSTKNSDNIQYSLKKPQNEIDVESNDRLIIDKKSYEKTLIAQSSKPKTIKGKAGAFKNKIGEDLLATKIQMTNAQAGIEFVGKKLGVKNIESLTQNARSSKAKANSMLSHAQFNYVNDKKVGEGLDKIFKKSDSVLPRKDFEYYLLHKHNIDRLKCDKPVFDTTAKQSSEICKSFEEKYPQILDSATEIYAYMDNLLQIRVDSGLITDKQAQLLRKKYPHYVPTLRDTDSAIGTGGIQGKNNVAVKSTIGKAKGSDLAIIPLEVSIAKQTMQVNQAAALNELLSKMYDGAVKKGNNEFIETSKIRKVNSVETEADEMQDVVRQLDKATNEITFFNNGHRVTMRVCQEMFVGVEDLAPHTDFNNPVFRGLNKAMNGFKKLVTAFNPAFLVRNSIRDLQSVILYSKYGKSFVKNYIKAMNEIRTDGEIWQRYCAAGGFASSVFNLEMGISGTLNKHGLKKAEGNVFKRGLQLMENANVFVEQAPRFAEFISSLDAGNTAQQALLDSADITINFGRGGILTKKLNSVIMPFLNPAVQGASKLFRSFYGKKSLKQWAWLVGKLLVMGIGLSALNGLLYDDDEDYQKLSYRDKENNYLIKVGDVFIKIPRGREFTVIAGLFNRSQGAIRGDENAFKGYLGSVTQAITPISNFSRTILSPFGDVNTNTTWYGGAIEGRQFENVEPKKRYDESTSEIAKWLGGVLNYSPKKIHYLLDQYSGVVGDFVLPLTTKKSERGFLAANFTIDPTLANKLSDDFYLALEKAQYSKNNGDLSGFAQVRFLNKAKSAISDMYEQKKNIENSDLSRSEKQVQLKVIQANINMMYNTAVQDCKKFAQAFSSIYNVLPTEKSDEEMSDNIDYAYREATFLLYGGERALKEHGAQVYEKAAALNGLGISFDKFYEIYFACKEIESDKVGGSSVKGSRSKKIMQYLKTMGLTLTEQYLVMGALGYSSKELEVRMKSYINKNIKTGQNTDTILKLLNYA